MLPLPLPEPAALQHSRKLVAAIYDAIDRAGGALEFSRYMDLALYAPGLGYYVAGQRKFGPDGDFVTAPELGDLFAACLGRCVADVLHTLAGGDVVEFGAGSGALAAGLLQALEDRDAVPRRYRIIELSAELRQRQREHLQATVPQWLDRVEWLATLPAHIHGVVLANEVLDAMPVVRFQVRDGVPQAVYVIRENDGFGEMLRRPAPPDLGSVAGLGLPEGYSSELNLTAQGWVATVASCLRRGVALLIDYGFPAREYYHPQRTQGTLLCHYRHRVHSDPYRLVGLQDITAHVDFSALAASGTAAGLDLLGYTTQAAFLLSAGLLELMPCSTASLPEQVTINNEVQRLTSPAEMGELFKVMALGRQVAGPLTGFSGTDHRARL